MASSTTIRSPSATSSPLDAAIFTIVPCMGEVRASPEAPRAAVPPRAPRCLRGLAWAGAAERAVPGSCGMVTSSRLPPTSTTTVCRSGSSAAGSGDAANGSMLLSNSVSIHRVCTVKGVPSGVANAGSETTARWNGTTVGMPSTVISCRARRERSSACVRVAPVTTSLASMESKFPPTVSPASTPESTRTPGPEGTVNVVRVPGEGMKLRPASSPLMRNSMLCPRTSGSS